MSQAITFGVGLLHGSSQVNQLSPPFYRWGSQVPERSKCLPIADKGRVGTRIQTLSCSPGGRGLLPLLAPASVCLSPPSPLSQAHTCSRSLGAATDDCQNQGEGEGSSGTGTGQGQRRGVLKPQAGPQDERQRVPEAPPENFFLGTELDTSPDTHRPPHNTS